MSADLIGWVSIALGWVLIAIPCVYLFHAFPRIAKKQDTAISMVALRFSAWLGVAGLILLFLGILYLMRIIPWYDV